MNRKVIVAIVIFATLGSVTTLFFPAQETGRRLVIATTTSTVDTGLLDFLKPYFDKSFGGELTWLSLGTGQAIAVASRGDADVLLVHERAKEDAFVKSGNGTHRVTVMYNDFIIIGPKEDPSGVSGLTSTSAALTKIAEAGENGKATFVSRGDQSGTHALELKLWDSIKLKPQGTKWYLEAGQGMAGTIRIANEKLSYTMSDRGTWIKQIFALGENMRLTIVLENNSALVNPYGIILLNPAKYPNVKSDLAEKFFMFLISDKGQKLIADYKIDGKQLFFPVFGKVEAIGLPAEEKEVRYWVERLERNGLKIVPTDPTYFLK